MLDDIDTSRFQDQHVGVLYGGASPERPVSLETGQALADALRSSGYDVTLYDVPDDLDAVVDDRPAAVLLALHGGAGENGTIQGFLETLGIPYSGSGVLGSALALDKGRSRVLLQDAGLMVPDGERLDFEDATRPPSEWETWLSRHSLELPLVVKPTDGGSSQNVSICRTFEDLAEATGAIVGAASEVDPTSAVLLEEYIEGREYTAGFFDDTFLGALEVIPGEAFYNYEAKYESDETEYHVVEEPSLLQRLEAAGDLARRTLGASGVLRVDFIAETQGDPVLYVLEINTIPGMTETSLVPKLADGQGVGFKRFADLMLSAASCRPQLDSTVT